MTMIIRPITHRYHDPLSLLWIQCAEQIGFRITRTPDAYASTDGEGLLLIGEDSLLDADDTLAQMIFHELCHALIEGEEGQKRVDWGLGTSGGSNPWREHACLRLQAYLAGRYGLRDFFAPTTDFRVSFWNQLPVDPLVAEPSQGGRREKSCVAARLGVQRAFKPAWWLPLDAALTATAGIAALVAEAVQPGARNKSSAEHDLPPLWSTAHSIPARHPAGHAPIAAYLSEYTCGDCAWQYVQRGVSRCHQSSTVRLDAGTPACVNFEPAAELDCQTCGACCREAYQSVEISRREPLIRRHPEWVVRMETYLKLKREGSRCVALGGGHTPGEPYACAIYEYRPKTCREFERGSSHCLEARRRVGLSL